MAANCDVIIAGSGASLQLLRKEFPDLAVVELPGYPIRYSSSASQVLKIARQLPALLKTCLMERRATEKAVAQYDIHVVISDNRYGCWSARSTNVFMGHQVNLILPPLIKGLKRVVNRLHSRLAANFDQWWVPDYFGPNSLSGALSASNRLGLRYVGPLSRFSRIERKAKVFDVAFLLSGPEPQRTLLERWVLQAAPTTSLKVALVRGTATKLEGTPPPNVTAFGMLGSDEVAGIIATSDVVVARSGYSTIMDLFYCGGRAVFVPTPGQTEQEYLACRMAELGYAGYIEQHRIDFAAVLHAASAFSGFPGKAKDHSQLRRALDEVLAN
jgi:hypothetical protein